MSQSQAQVGSIRQGCGQTTAYVTGRITPSLLRRFGQTGVPTPATHVFRRTTRDPEHSAVVVDRWLLINETNSTVTRASTFNGRTGERFNAAMSTQWLNWDDVRYWIVDYEPVAVSTCPIAVPIEDVTSENPWAPFGLDTPEV